MKKYIMLLIIIAQIQSIHCSIYYGSINFITGLSIPIDKEIKVRGLTTVSMSPFGIGNKYLYLSFLINYSYLTNSVVRNSTRLSETHKLRFGPGLTFLIGNTAHININTLLDINLLYDYYYLGFTTGLSIAGEVYRTNNLILYIGGQAEFTLNRSDRIKMEANVGPIFSIVYRNDMDE